MRLPNFVSIEQVQCSFCYFTIKWSGKDRELWLNFFQHFFSVEEARARLSLYSLSPHGRRFRDPLRDEAAKNRGSKDDRRGHYPSFNATWTPNWRASVSRGQKNSWWGSRIVVCRISTRVLHGAISMQINWPADADLNVRCLELRVMPTHPGPCPHNGGKTRIRLSVTSFILINYIRRYVRISTLAIDN